MAENTESWRSTLPEDLRENPTLKDLPDVATLAKSYVETKSLVGSSIRPPGPDAAPEARKEFLAKLQKAAPELVYLPSDEKARAEVEGQLWSALGRPADEKAYSLEGVPPELGLDEAQARKVAKEMGYTVSQFKKLLAVEVENRQKALEAHKAGYGELKKELGAAYDERVAQAAAAFEKITGNKDAADAIRTGRATAADVRTWAAVAKAIGGETNVVGQQGAGASGRLTPEEARLQLAELRGNPEYFNSSLNPAKHELLKRRAIELTELMLAGQ